MSGGFRVMAMGDGGLLVVAFAVGVLMGGGLSYALLAAVHRRHAERERELYSQRELQMSSAMTELQTSFAALSRDALSANTEDFLKLAASRLEHQTFAGDQTLETKKKLIDARLEEMNAKLQSVTQLLTAIERQRAESHGAMVAQLERTNQAAHQLQETTSKLREALVHPGRRGQWGERMAEDVLRSAGMVEGVNYRKQESDHGRRPDFTFLLPGDRVVHMDVKFPLANYLKMLESPDEASRDAAGKSFLKDVRSRIREVAERNYIDADGKSLEMLLVFIPNDQVYAFIHEHDPDLLDDCLRRRVVMCSPFTLYAVLCVIREAVERYRVESAAARILELLGRFRSEWNDYVKVMGTMGKKLDEAVDAYRQLVGVRARQLDRQLDRIDSVGPARMPEGRAGGVLSEEWVAPPAGERT